MIRNAAAQRGLARSRSIPVSAKPAGKPLPASLHCLLPIATVALAVSQSEQETQGKRASPLEPPNRVVPRVNLAYMQDKRRRNDFASTEVGEATGGRVFRSAGSQQESRFHPAYTASFPSYGGASCLASVPQGKGTGRPDRASEPGWLRVASLTGIKPVTSS